MGYLFIYLFIYLFGYFEVTVLPVLKVSVIISTNLSWDELNIIRAMIGILATGI